MKAVILQSFVVAVAFLLSAASGQAQEKVELKGTIKNPKGNKVYLTRYSDLITFETIKVDSATLDKKGNFSMNFNWAKPGEATFAHGDEVTHLYLTPGDKLSLTLNTAKFDETLTFTGQGAVINNYKAQKLLRGEKTEMDRAMAAKKTEKAFVQFTDSVLKSDLAFAGSYFGKQKYLTAAEKTFAENEKAALRYEWAESRLQYPNMHAYFNKLEKKPALGDSYYSFLESLSADNEQSAPTDGYLDFAEAYADFLTAKSREENPDMKERPYQIVAYRTIGNTFQGQTKAFLQARALYDALTMNSDVDAVEEVFPEFRNEASRWPEYVRIVERAYERALPLRPGNRAPNFRTTSADGKEVALTDFLGRVVYVDVWASWCGPCIAEIPHAKKLMEEMEGREVVFLNVSVDQSEKAWRAAMDKHGVHGTNVLAKGAFNSDIAQSYNIRGIPHYILIGRDGSIISNNAARPSSGAKDQIEAALNR